MSIGIPTPAECGDPCTTPETLNIPGQKGDAGDAGADGANGISAFSITTSGFVVPAVNGSVTIDVSNSSWMAVTQTVYIQNAGYYEVLATPTNTTVTVKNWGWSGNTAPGGAVASLQKVSPSGLKGVDGTSPTSNLVYGSDTLDFPSVAATGGTEDLTVAVVGASVNDPCMWSRPTSLNAGLTLEAFVTAPDVVTFRVTNTTAAPIDPAPAFFSVVVYT